MTAKPAMEYPLAKTRLIMYHKSGSSGMTKFLRSDEQTVCVFSALPKLSTVLEKHERPTDEKILNHPSSLIKQAADWLGMEQANFEVDSDYCEKVDVADGPLTVYLVRFKTQDPPRDNAEKIGGKFISLTEAVGLPPAEMELLRRAYEVIMC
jgi:hypothetical protein